MALTLLLVGMITVFIVLILVVITGNLLIIAVNKYLPEKPVPEISQSQLSGNKVSAIVAAVDIITKGKGKIKNIDRIKS